MLSRDEVLKIAELAKIELNDEEVEKFRKDLSDILNFVGQISDVSGSEVDSGRQSMGLENVFRKDEESGLVKEKGQRLIDQAPKTKDGFVEVPEVFGKTEDASDK